MIRCKNCGQPIKLGLEAAEVMRERYFHVDSSNKFCYDNIYGPTAEAKA